VIVDSHQHFWDLGRFDYPWLTGQRNLAVTANTYSHVLVDETEIDYAAVLADTRLSAQRVQHGAGPVLGPQ
jgi:predicted TIM-barrel fold metal-dependent hydrolase